MDLDDLMPRKTATVAAIGDNLSSLSVADLEQRIKDLAQEIERVRAELVRKQRHDAAARALFKS